MIRNGLYQITVERLDGVQGRQAEHSIQIEAAAADPG
jgi:hypothetical protein